MKNVREISLEEMAEDIDDLVWRKGVECFKVTESFVNKKQIYIVRGLHMDIDEGIVCCSDADMIIKDNIYVLMMFLRRCVRSIIRIKDNEYVRDELTFSDGNIYIETLD